MSRDIKLENTLLVLQPDKKPLLKLCDFGYSKVKQWLYFGVGWRQCGSSCWCSMPGCCSVWSLVQRAWPALGPPLHMRASNPCAHLPPRLPLQHDTLDSIAKSKVGTPGYTAPGAPAGTGAAAGAAAESTAGALPSLLKTQTGALYKPAASCCCFLLLLPLHTCIIAPNCLPFNFTHCRGDPEHPRLRRQDGRCVVCG